jgi:hypothetical protein
MFCTQRHQQKCLWDRPSSLPPSSRAGSSLQTVSFIPPGLCQLVNGCEVIVLQMFIAVINENFQVAEEAKRERQASNYVANYQAEVRRPAWVRRLNPYRWVRANPVTVRVEHLPSNLVLPIQEALVNSYAVPRQSNTAPSVSHAIIRQFNVENLLMCRCIFTGPSFYRRTARTGSLLWIAQYTSPAFHWEHQIL